MTLNKQAFALGTLVGDWGMPADLALRVLELAAGKMPSFKPNRPWRPAELKRKIGDAFAAGLRHPRHRERRYG